MMQSQLYLTIHSELAACALLALAILAVEGAIRPPTQRAELRIQANHIIPSTIQVILITYWSFYWPEAWDVPRIPLELLYAFGLDYLIHRVRRTTWPVGIGPVPIVLSSNLFIRFAPDRFDGILTIVTIALLSKHFLRLRGRHIFNPSAFGLAVFGLYHHTATWRVDFVDVAHHLNLAPNMAELIFALGLIVALRVPIVAVTFGAAVGLQAWHYMPGSLITPWPYWPPMLLVFTFLATDPVTIPRSGTGRLLFGLGVGFGTGLASNTLVAAGMPDYFGKIVAVPVCNLLAPMMDSLSRLRFLERLLAARWNVAHVAAYCVIFLLTFDSWRKTGAFEARLHVANQTPLIVSNAGSPPRCAHNPIFCRRFTMLREVELWTNGSDGPE